MPEQQLIPAVLLVFALLAAFVLLSLVPASIAKRRMKRALAAAVRGRLALTYDDGPGPDLTPPLLEVLRRHGAKATFFLVGFRAQRHPEAIDRMAAGGHELGNHTHWHKHVWRCWPWRGVRDVHQGYETLSRWIAGNALFRPPFGKMTTWSFRAATRRGAATCFWTHDGGDTWPTLPNPLAIVQSVVQSGGGVVLLHSHDRGQDRQQYVLEVTDQLLDAARQHGLPVCIMSEILDASSRHAVNSSLKHAASPA